VKKYTVWAYVRGLTYVEVVAENERDAENQALAKLSDEFYKFDFEIQNIDKDESESK
jgi:hypothetical protein